MIAPKYVSRAGTKLEFALTQFGVDVAGQTCADFGASTGGFVDCLLSHGAAKVYAVETGYGLLAWNLRTDARVAVLEKTNAVHVDLPEQVDLITIDAGWTKQAAILPSAYRNLKASGRVITLVKLSFEIGRKGAQVKESNSTAEVPQLLATITTEITNLGFTVVDSVKSPILGAKGKNVEYLLHLRKLN